MAFGVVGYSETTNEADPLKSDQSSVSRDGQIQKVRVTEKVIPRSPQLHLRSGSNISQEYSDDAGEEIIAVSVWKTRPDVHHLTSQILSILIDFTQTSVPFLRSFFKSLDLYNSGTRKGIKKR